MMTHFIIGIESTYLSKEDIFRLTNPQVIGVILFKRNYENSLQLKNLTHQIKRLRHDLIISVDHEGGRVQRFQGDGFSTLAPPFSLQNSTQADIKNHASILASELKAHGVDLSFTPVVDLYNPNSRVIAKRAFSDDPQEVIDIAQSYIQTLHKHGMPSVLKHFPGHGLIQEDSHLEVACSNQNLKDLEQTELKPFITLINNKLADSVMVGHIQFPRIDQTIASMSRFWLTDYLRGKLGFNGIIFSDDMGMFAATNASKSTFDACQKFFEAGGDIAIIGNDFSGIDSTLAKLKQKPQSDESIFNQRWQKFTQHLTNETGSLQ
ncbi:beta-N-acetylhexosaminidase [Facilibium subflavum]|uniref:beta-N-acetylhexosaminidase n=1 Tax=Facilibium subflavum TaxID=2219058 RepID=UPI000E647ED4|nr:beta-N-acetylhexosaminidase [Facilibium subflavum]